MIKKFISGTGEWAKHSVNINDGSCRNDCLYCYAKANAIRFNKATAESWKTTTINGKAVNMKRGRKEGNIMAFTQHDIYPENLHECTVVLSKLLDAGNKVLIVSKPNPECIRAFCSSLGRWKSQILFRFTIGSSSDVVLKNWEPNAPCFKDRVMSLKYAFNEGFETSVSCEPMLDLSIDKVIDATLGFVTDAIWLGKPNKLVARVKTNNPGDLRAEADAKDLEALFDDDYVMRLYGKYRDNPKIKWKDSIKAVVGLERATVKGLDR